MKKIITILALCCMVFGITNAQDSKYSFKEDYKVAETAGLKVSSYDGDIHVKVHNEPSIAVYFKVMKKGKLLKMNRAEMEKAIKGQLKVEIENVDNELEIVVSSTKKYGNFNYRDAIYIDFEIYVPKKTTCGLRTSDGSISIIGLSSDQDCITSDGDIEVADTVGDIKVKTSDGDIELKSLVGKVSAKTSDGDIELKDIDGDVRAKTSDGDILVSNVSGDLVTKTSDGSVTHTDR